MKRTAQNHRIKNIEFRIKNIFFKFSRFQIPDSRFCAFSAGFTLIELLVAITILATLIGGVLLTLNPVSQIHKSQDAQREQDINQVKTALDLYYQDNKCYPKENAIPFGQEWRDGNTVYMKKVPQDPTCNGSNGTCYKYRTDNSSCPQWNVVFAQLSKASLLADTCPISSLSNCTPAGYQSNSWACVMSGAVNCSDLASASLVGGVETVSPTATPTLMPSATPTPTPSPTPVPPLPGGSFTYNITPPNRNTNPYISKATVMPLYPSGSLPNKGIGSTQSIEIWINDTVGNVNSVKVKLLSDNKSREFTLTRVSGTDTNGSWGGQSQPWQIDDTYNTRYGYEITATDDKGNTFSTIISVI